MQWGDSKALEGLRMLQGPLHSLLQPALHIMQASDVRPGNCMRTGAP